MYAIVILDSNSITFDHMINSLKKVYGYQDEQALQIATIIHNKGKYSLKEYEDRLEVFKDIYFLKEEGLEVTYVKN